MASGLRDLTARLRLDTTQFSKGLRSLQSTLKVVGGAMTAASAGLAYAVRQQMTAADEMSKAAQKYGVPIESLSKLKYAADMSGVSFETMGTGLRKLSQNMALAGQGNKTAAELFTRLGVSAKNADGSLRATEDVLTDVADVLSKMPDGAEKTALAMELFGKSGAEMIPMLNGGKSAIQGMMDEAASLGIVISEKTGKAAENFNDNLSRVSTAIKGLVVQFTAALAPTLEMISEKMVALTMWFRDLSPETQALAAKITLFAAAAGPLILGLGLVIGPLTAVVGAMKALSLAVLTNPFVLIGAAAVAAAVLIYENWDGMTAYFAGIWDSVKASAEVTWGAIKDAIGGAIQYVIDKWNEFLALLTAGLETAQNIGNALANAIGLGDDYQKKMSDAGFAVNTPESMAAVAASISGSDMRIVGIGIADGLADGIGAGMDANKAEIERYLGGVTETAKDEFDTHSPSRVFRRIGQYLTEGLALGIGDNKPMVDTAVGAVTDSAVSSVQTAAESLRSAGKGLFGDWITGAKSASEALAGMAKRLADMLADSAFDTLFGSGGAFGGLFGALASAFGFAKGGVFSGGQVQAFANGGVVAGATAFGLRSGLGIMGEAGPEAIMPLSRGADGKLGVRGGGGGRLTVTVGFDQSAGSFTAMVQDEAGRVVAQAAPQIVRESVRSTAAAMRKTKSFGN